MYQLSVSIDMKRWALSSPNHCGNQQQQKVVVKRTIFIFLLSIALISSYLKRKFKRKKFGKDPSSIWLDKLLRISTKLVM